MSRETVGTRNKNFLNIKNNPDNPWNGSIGTDRQGHAIFDDPVYGIRAAIINLRSYWFIHERRTILAIIERWAPEDAGNNPIQYADFVSSRLGVDKTNVLNLFDEERSIKDKNQLEKLIKAMAEYENYNGFQIPDGLFEQALVLV